MLARLALAASVASLAPVQAAADELAEPCRGETFDGALYTACAVDLSDYELALFWRGEDGRPIAQPQRLRSLLEARGEEMVLATNGGMYHEDRRPVGLFISGGVVERPLVRGDGPGNFQLLPNGVFFVASGVAGIAETEAFHRAGLTPDLATQSGPLLVSGGALHPAFRPASDSVTRRSGIGVSQAGDQVWIVISETPVNLHSFARFFRDHLGLADALYLDGRVSRLDVPGDQRREFGPAMGPILAVTRKQAARAGD